MFPSKPLPQVPDIISDLNFLESKLCPYLHIEKSHSVEVFNFFDRQTNIFDYTIELLKSYKKNTPKHIYVTFVERLINALNEYSTRGKIFCELSIERKIEALEIVCDVNKGCIIEKGIDLFKIKEDWQNIKQRINKLLTSGSLKQAFYIIAAVEAQEEFSLEQVALPMFFLQKEAWLQNYLNTHERKLQFVKILDNVCDNTEKVHELIRSLNIEGVRGHHYTNSWIQKRMTTLLDSFNIDIIECPVLYGIRLNNAVNYLYRKRYIQDDMSQEAWEELTVSIVKDNVAAQKELLTKLVCIGESEKAQQLAIQLNLNKNDWPDILLSGSYLTSPLPVDSPSENMTSPYLSLRLDRSCIFMVDTPEKFVDMVTEISENYVLVAFDAEWRPNLGLSKEVISLLQLAVWDSIYLIDILVLKESLTSDVFMTLNDKIFANPQILKLGYGSLRDFHLLAEMFVQTKKVALNTNSLDIGNFFKEVKCQYPSTISKLDYEGNIDCDSYKGLSLLCLQVLGKPLNKEEQFSNWERRPLREKQVIYAAMDAHCLLLIYEKLYHVLEEDGLNMETLIKSISSTPAGKKVEKKKSKKTTVIKPSYSCVAEFKVVVDTMLQGLGRYLRMCGADVAILKNEDDHLETVKISQAENRVILTCGAPYEKILGYIPEEMCISVSASLSAKEQAAFVFNYFNITINESDIFSRCMVCNEGHYLKVPCPDLHQLWHKWKENENCATKSIPDVLTPYYSYDDGFITEDSILHTGIQIQYQNLHLRTFENIHMFLICTSCGKVYWEGSHYHRTKHIMCGVLEESLEMLPPEKKNQTNLQPVAAHKC